MNKNIIIYIVLYCFSNGTNAVMYDTLSHEMVKTTNMPMINIGYDPLASRDAIKTQVKQCVVQKTCLIGVDARTSSFINLPNDEIKEYILGDEYHFKFIKKSKNSAIIYTTDNNQTTNLIIITTNDDVYSLLLANSPIVDLVIELNNEAPSLDQIIVAGVNTRVITTSTTLNNPVDLNHQTKTVFVGTLSEYIDIDLVDVPLEKALNQILPGWHVRFKRELNINKIISITAEKSSKLSREVAVNNILNTFGYRPLYYQQKRIIIITDKE